MLSMLGGIVGDSAVQRAHREWGKAWMFKHPSPWDYMFFMNHALEQGSGLVLVLLAVHDGARRRIDRERDDDGGRRRRSTVRQDGQMPSPVVLKVKFAASWPGDQADVERDDARRAHGDRHVAGGRVVRGAAGRSRRISTSAHGRSSRFCWIRGVVFRTRSVGQHVAARRREQRAGGPRWFRCGRRRRAPRTRLG